MTTLLYHDTDTNEDTDDRIDRMTAVDCFKGESSETRPLCCRRWLPRLQVFVCYLNLVDVFPNLQLIPGYTTPG